MGADSQPRTVAGYIERAKELLPHDTASAIFGGGANPGTASMDAYNVDAWQQYELRPHVMVDVSRRSTATDLLGEQVSAPIVLAPIGSHVRAHPDGELASARAAAAAGVIMGVSTVSSFTLEEVACAASGRLWFQLYIFRTRSVSAELVRRAAASGYCAIVVTVDNPGTRTSERRYRSTKRHVEHTVFPNLRDTMEGTTIGTAQFHQSLDDSISWQDVDWLRSLSELPLVVKGVQRADDAARCRECGVDGIVVSNHGGQGLDCAQPTADVLTEVCDAVGADLEVLVDGGVRSGADILKALALGARAVLIGKPVYSGLAVNGEAGVRDVIDILMAELGSAMSLCGVSETRHVPRDLVAPRARGQGLSRAPATTGLRAGTAQRSKGRTGIESGAVA